MEQPTRYFTQLCLCDYPIQAAGDRSRCEVCGGIILPARRFQWIEEPPTPHLRFHPDVRLFLLVLLAVWVALKLLGGAR